MSPAVPVSETPAMPAGRKSRRSLQGVHWVHFVADWVPQVFDRLLKSVGNLQLRLLFLLLLVLAIPLIITPIAVWQQGIIAFLLILIGWGITELEQHHGDRRTSQYLHLLMVMLSVLTTLRYLFYRTRYTINFDTGIDTLFSVLLFTAELYAIMTLVLAYFQTLMLKDRQSIDISHIPLDQWLKVDIYIPTYNEDIEIVRKTILGALAIDYPADKKTVYVLDDGRAEKYRARRAALGQMCADLGCTLMTRDNNDHAKAGNINTAMRKTGGDLILILDCDHIPSRPILRDTVGFFLNPKVALVQTPHWFYNPDPFERNLLTGGSVPVGNELFYKVLQKGNDFWNAAFFCGSAAIIRKQYVLEVGGIATETVTEDCHTSFRLHSLGYESVYYDRIMVAGLAPETFSSYVGQQVRWARGMAQILRLENPLFNGNLSLAQRLCYFSATSHFFFGFPRLMYAIAPVMFLMFGINPVRGLGIETLAYALPHILLSIYTNHITYKNVRFSFWNEIYEFAMSFQAGIVTLLALINPKLGSFNVTDKGVSVTERSFDWTSARFLTGITAMVAMSLVAVPFWIILRPEDMEAVTINVLWTGFNLILLVSALLVALEQPQLRRSHRLDRRLTATLYSDGQAWTGQTRNISETGCELILTGWANLPDAVELEILGDYGARAFVNARIIRAVPINETQVRLAIDFYDLTEAQTDALCVVIYADVRQWYSQTRATSDAPFQSLRFIAASLLRSLNDPQPASTAIKVRKHIRADAQLYWDSQFYPVIATEIGSQSLRVELDTLQLAGAEQMQRSNALVGLLFSPVESLVESSVENSMEGPVENSVESPVVEAPVSVQRLLAQVETVQTLDTPAGTRLVVELQFPEKTMTRQAARIKSLIKHLH
jgi:cellulose synthase (UDP-forming)